MSLTVGGHLLDYTHPPDVMMITSTQNYSAPYPAQASCFSDYDVSDRGYFHSWIFGASPSEMPSVSPEWYGDTCSNSPSSTGLYHAQYCYSETIPNAVRNIWQDCQITADLALSQNIPILELCNYEAYTNAFGDRCLRRQTSANRKERKRTESFNNAFSNLRSSIPNVPSDTKLSKIRTLRLAIDYISYLTEVLENRDSVLAQNGFNADVSSKRRERSSRTSARNTCISTDSCDSDDSTATSVSGSSGSITKVKGRTGWLQEVWASELKSSPQQTESKSKNIIKSEYSM